MQNKILISLIIPCYNEETNIQKGVLDKVGNFTKNDDRFNDVIIVDDGSTDTTKKIIRDTYLPQFHKFKLVENKHQGKAFAVITGIKNAQQQYVMFSDMDLATPVEESEKIIKAMENNYDIAIGSRSSTRDGAPLTRQILAKGYILIRDILINLKGIKDTQCGFKIFKREVALKIINNLRVFHPDRKIQGPSVTAGFDLEFLFLATKLGYRIKEVSVLWRHVETKRVNFIHDAVETLKDILRIKYYYLAKKYDL